MHELVKMMREGAYVNDLKRDEGLTTPESIDRVDNIQYSDDAEFNLLDLYRPKALIGNKMPVIVSVHGGGWVYATKEIYQWYCLSLAERGFAVVNFTYRLAPENKFPAVVDDMNKVYEWILSNAEKYDLDSDNIFMLGDSAGGHYCALYAAFSTNPEYQKKIGLKAPEGLNIKAIAVNCGNYNPYNVDGKEDKMIAFIEPEGVNKAEFAELVNVNNYITPSFPKTFVMTSSGDFLKTQPIDLVKALEENDVEFEYHRYGTKENVLPHVFHCNVKDTVDAKRCNDDECNYFKKFI